MKIFKIIIAFVVLGLVTYLFDSMEAGAIITAGGITGGPLRSFEWGGLTLMPSGDGEPEFETSGINFERKASSNGDTYAEGEARIGYVQQECQFTPAKWIAFKALQDDAVERSGTATFLNGDVLSLNCSIDGEHILTSGKATVKLAGAVELQ